MSDDEVWSKMVWTSPPETYDTRRIVCRGIKEVVDMAFRFALSEAARRVMDPGLGCESPHFLMFLERFASDLGKLENSLTTETKTDL